MLTEKANAICLLEVLKEYSDAEHILPMREIIAKMQSLYGIKIDRRTVYGAVALLIELGTMSPFTRITAWAITYEIGNWSRRKSCC